MRVVLLNGPRQVGKDTIASAFANLLNDDKPGAVQIMPVAKPMKLRAIAEYYDCDSHDSLYVKRSYDRWEQEKDEKLLSSHKTPRELYIEYGNRLRAEKGDDAVADLWLEQAAIVCADAHKTGLPDYLVVPDVRFIAEYDAACKLVGIDKVMVVHVYRDVYEGTYTWQNDIGSYLFEAAGRHERIYNQAYVRDALGDTLKMLVKRWELAVASPAL